MTAEGVIAAQLKRRIGSLSPGHRHPIKLEEVVWDGVSGFRSGPHTVGWVERTAAGGIRIRLVSTAAGRTARTLIEEELLDVVLSHDYPPVVRLTG